MSGLPHSDQLKITERYTMAKDGSSFDSKITIDGSEDLHQLLDRRGPLREEARLPDP